MRLLLIIFFLPSISFSQIHFEEIVYDFGLIREDGEVVNHAFGFVNKATEKAEIIYIQPSCGCTVGSFKERVINNHDSSWIELTYNPKDRPGYFLKPVEIGFKINGDTIRKTIAVKGYTINSNSKLLEKKETIDKYEIRIKPVSFNVKYPDSWNYEGVESLTEFINDITFVIDQHNFAEIRIDIYTGDTTKKRLFKSEIRHTRDFIQSELNRRNYGNYQVGFHSTTFHQKELKKDQAAIVKISSAEYNDDFIESSIIKREGIFGAVTEPDHKSVYVESNIIHFVEIDQKPRKFKKSNEFDSFIEKCVRNALSRQEIWLGITVPNKKDHKKIISKIPRKVRKELISYGLNDSIIHFHKPDINPEIKEPLLAEYLPVDPDTILKVDSLQIFDLSQYKPHFFDYSEVDEQPRQNLPAYFQMIKGSKRDIDTLNPYFRKMMDAVAHQIKEGHKIEFIIESSASKSPSRRGVDNIFISRERIMKTKDIIVSYLKSQGLNSEDIIIKKALPLISGPEYDLRYYIPQYYYYFQYLKVIPVYAVEDTMDSYIPPYKINFTYTDLEVLNNSPVFQSFVNKLADHIDKYGYVEIIIESSSSHLPARNTGKPKHLSYHRAQEAKNSIYEEMRRRRINPSKVIITEERTLVQGPEYKYDYDKNSDIYEKFQYVKIIPIVNLKQK